VIRAAVVGTGGIANSHARAFAQLGERVRLEAAVEIDEARLAAFCDEHEVPRRYTDLPAMLEAERPDLVSVCTPPFLHADQAIAALEAGAWVWSEKPLCAGLAELDRIEEAERRAGRYCSSVVQWRFGSAGRHLKRLIETEAMGRLLVGLCNTTWFRDAAYYQVPWRGRWDTELGGVTMGHGIHAMDLFLWLFGEWEEVAAMVGTLDREIVVEDTSMAVVRFARGAMGSIVNSVLSPRQESYMRFDFQRSTVELHTLYGYANAHWTYTAGDGVSGEEAARWSDLGRDVPSTHAAQLAALLDHMERGERPQAGLPEIRPTFELISSLYKSAATCRVVRRGEIVRGDPFYEHVAGTLRGR
jgi:predicted dehydrogenase